MSGFKAFLVAFSCIAAISARPQSGQVNTRFLPGLFGPAPQPQPHPSQFRPQSHPQQFHPQAHPQQFHQPSRNTHQVLGQSFNKNDQHTQIATIGALVTGGLAVGKFIQGDDDIRIKPNVGVNLDKHGNLRPVVGLQGQVGNGDINPTFNLGAQIDPTGKGQLISPHVGTGVSFGQDNGGINPSINTGFNFQNGQASGTVGGSAGLGPSLFSFGGLSNQFGGNGFNFGR